MIIPATADKPYRKIMEIMAILISKHYDMSLLEQAMEDDVTSFIGILHLAG